MDTSSQYCLCPKQPYFKLRSWSRVRSEGTKKTFFSLSRLIRREYEEILIASKISPLRRKKNYKRKHHPRMHICNTMIVAHQSYNWVWIDKFSAIIEKFFRIQVVFVELVFCNKTLSVIIFECNLKVNCFKICGMLWQNLCLFSSQLEIRHLNEKCWVDWLIQTWLKYVFHLCN